MCANDRNQATVIKSGAKSAKTEQIQKTEIIAILRLTKGFSRFFYQIANRRFYFSSSPVSTGLSLINLNLFPS